MEKFKEVFLKIIEITEYSGDKQTHTGRFLLICSQETVLRILENLPFAEKETLKLLVKNITDPTEIIEIISGFITPAEYEKLFNSVAKEELNAYLKNLHPALSEEKKFAIDEYLNSLEKFGE